MDTQPHIADATGKMIDSCTRSWWTMTQFLWGFPGPGDRPQPHLTEAWLTIARMMKHSPVSAVNAGFDEWEGQYRRAMRQWQSPPPRR